MTTRFQLNYYILKGLQILSLLLIALTSQSQDIILTDQADVDAFDPATTVIDGSLTISAPSNIENGDITDLSNLSNLTTVNGMVLIFNNPELITLSGLSNLSYVEGDFKIFDNEMLGSLDELSALDSIGGNFELENLLGLTKIENLNSLISIGGNFEVTNCEEIETIEDIANLEIIGGDLFIRNNDKLVEINAFTKLVRISGNLFIWTNQELTDLKNFNSLIEVTGNFNLNNNPLLDYVSAFSILNSIGGYLFFTQNHKMENLPNFTDLKSIGGSLTISENDDLKKINGLNMLESVSSLGIQDNPNFKEINDLPNLRTIDEQLTIKDNPMLLQIGGLNALDSIGTNLIIEHNDELASISGLNNLIKTGSQLTINENQNLLTISGFQKIENVGFNLSITNLLSLNEISGFNSLISVDEKIYLSQLPEIGDFDSFTKLESVGDGMIITSNAKLQNVDGFTSLKTIGSNLFLQTNEDLRNVDGFSSLTYIGGILRVLGNIEVDNLDGFSNVTQVGGSLSISSNDNLRNIDGMSKLTSIPGGISVSSNDILANIDGLSNITTVGQSLYFRYNHELTHLDGLSNITNVGFSLTVGGNSKLEDCCGIQSLINDPGGVAGTIDIYNNPSECSFPDEVRNSYCGMRLMVDTNPPCINSDNGSIQVNVIAYDTIPFTYHWRRQEDGLEGTGISESDFFTIDNLSQGTYDLTVSNPRPDEATRKNILLPELDGKVFEIIEINTTNSTNQTDNGSIQLTLSGGAPPYALSWTGTTSGNEIGILDNSIVIPSLSFGTYDVTVTDASQIDVEVSITLLDETVPIFPCEKPLDIVILNDMSGSVDATEFKESKGFFIHFLNTVNIGEGVDESRASIIEWSSDDEQKVMVPMTGNYSEINAYKSAARSFSGGTSIHPALQFGDEYLENNGREGVEKVIVLSTDGTFGQVSPSLVTLADQLKAKGYHIITIAFDNAFQSFATRKLLKNIASFDALAPGAESYSMLDEDLAINIVNLYLCPIDPGSSATVYFNRDGAIEIDSIIPEKNCPYPEYVDIHFNIEAKRELSIPSGTPVTFYLNDPRQFSSTKVLTWLIPCTIPIGTSENYSVTVPVSGPSHFYAVLNDDGIQGAPINFPITELTEIAYTNNIDDHTICVGQNATLQALKYATSAIPACDTIVNYTINVCNISETDAFDVTITDEYPVDFILINSITNTNSCAVDNGSSFDIPANCCVTLNLTYDAANAQYGYYDDQDVILSGPSNQTYYNFLGENSLEEDVNIDGTIDCPSTVIEFTKEVNVDESCDDAYLVFTFTINNEMNIPIQGLSFTDIVPAPSSWAFEPYALEGLSMGETNIVDNEARFTINEVKANTIARFSMDLSVGKFTTDGQITNTATLENVPDPVNGGFKTLSSNSTNTFITASPVISIADTIAFQLGSDTIDLDATITGLGDVFWTTEGDGSFIDSSNISTQYILGIGDKESQSFSLFISVKTPCSESGKSIVILFQDCQINVEDLSVGACDDNGTGSDGSDDTYAVTFNLTAENPGNDSLYFAIIENDTLGPFSYGDQESIQLNANGIDNIITFIDSQLNGCSTQEIVNQESCSDECALNLQSFIISECDNNGTLTDPLDDVFTVTFELSANNPGLDSNYVLTIGNDTIGLFPYDTEHVITLPANGADQLLNFIDSQFEDCQLSETVNVQSCSNECILNLDSFVVSECDDNGTPSDNTDDTYTVTFNVSGANLGSDGTYFVKVSNNGIGFFSYGTEHQIQIPADGVDQIINFVDAQFADCQLTEIVNVENCSGNCILNLDSFTVSDCDDNGTPSDNIDDVYTVTFNISALNPGTEGTYLVVIATDTIGTFSYDSEEVITLPADGSDHEINFVDSQFEDCLLTEIVNVGSCSDECILNLISFTVSECDDNGTASDNTDDTYTVTFNVSGTNLGINGTYYTVIENDTIGIYSYHQEQEIILMADGVDHVISFIDLQFEDCIISEVINVESCSDECNLTLDNFIISECDDNGSPAESFDDFYTVEFNVVAANSGTDSSYIVVVGNDTIGTFSFGTDQMITLAADDVVDLISFIDSQNEDCILIESINIESCSDDCIMNLDVTYLSECDDNGTPADNTDDTYEIHFIFSAYNSGPDSTYFVIIENDTIGPYSYHTDQVITLHADGVDDIITFVDSQKDHCILTTSFNIESCSDECNLELDNFVISECDDNGTSTDPSDDFYTIIFNVSASNPGTDSSYIVTIESDTLGTYPFGTDQMVTMSANDNAGLINFIDSQNEDCILLESVNIENCSDVCLLSLDQFVVSECDDNGTAEDNTDDTYSIDFNVSASNPGVDSSYYLLIGNDTIDIFLYDEAQTISIAADGLDNEVKFFDTQNEDCFLLELVNIESCSDECSMNIAQFDVSECDGNGTPFDYSDDIFYVTFNIQSSTASSINGFNLIIDNETLGPFLYDEEDIVSLSADGKDEILRFVDAENEDCVHTEIVNIESCSEDCELNLDYFIISECDDNNTSDDETDDTYSITFNLSILTSNSDSFYSVFLGDESLGVFSYGIDHSIILSAEGLEKDMRFIDIQNEDCHYSEVIFLEDCSETEPVLDDIVIPNIFTPNNDSNNDNWSITFNNNSQIIKCTIYDRWGNKVYTNIQGQEVMWDGKYNGRDVSQGVYVYKVIYQSPVDNVVEILGDLTLIR